MSERQYSDETLHALLKKEFEYLRREFEDLRAELREDSKSRVTRAEFRSELAALEKDFEARVREIQLDMAPIKKYFNLIATIIVGAVATGIISLILIK